MKLAKSDRHFLEACQNPERRTVLIGNLITQRKLYYIIAGLVLLLCVAEPFVRMAGGRHPAERSATGGLKGMKTASTACSLAPAKPEDHVCVRKTTSS